ncbi:PspC domain-containing protein [Rubritalea spongiae]|uniref:PspC domain-containing protein n=1 Tax=Rubritalea spongiae TaxID=430797 RepID=A0ABW5E0L9_9BACT
MSTKVEKPMIGGVCYTLAKKANMAAWIMRVIFVCSTLLFGVGPLIYIVLWIFMPKAP